MINLTIARTCNFQNDNSFTDVLIINSAEISTSRICPLFPAKWYFYQKVLRMRIKCSVETHVQNFDLSDFLFKHFFFTQNP